MMDVSNSQVGDAASVIDKQHFWQQVTDVCHAEIGQSLSAEEQTDEAIALLGSLYSLCETGYDTHLQEKQDIDALLHNVLHASFLTDTPFEVSAAALTSLAVAAVSLPQLYLLYETLLRLSEHNANIFQSCPNAIQLLPRLVHHFWAARYAQEYNERTGDATLASTDGKNDGHEQQERLEWNVRHVRSSSKGNAVRQRAEQRDRILQIRLCDRSISLLYEICRSRRLATTDLRSIDATFVDHLFDLVEQSRNWTDDSYSFRLIKLIVALNEQFMVSGISAVSNNKARARKSTASASNTVLTVLRTRLNASKTFGENVIFMLNRASSRDAEDVCMQLLILKLLYLLFTTKETSHYFYTNDLKVLVDVFIRELSDLPDEHESLRHTYLRVLHPLLTNTQLLTYPYKRAQVRNLLVGLTSLGHLRDISATTQRLVERCLSAKWCVDLDQDTNGRGLMRAGEGLSHSLIVQSIGGGPSKVIQASVRLDSEGIAVPIESNGQPVQAATTSSADAAAVLAPQVIAADSAAHADGKAQQGLTHSRDDSSAERIGQTPAVSTILSEGGEINISSPTCYGDDELGSAQSHNVRPRWHSRLGSPPYLHAEHTKRVHSAIDVRRLTSPDEFDSENDFDSLGDTVSQSWHQAMAADVEKNVERKRAGTGSSLRTAVNVTANEDESDQQQQRRGSEGSLAFSNMHPSIRLQEADDHLILSSSRNSSNNTRRRPPAPPVARDRLREPHAQATAKAADDAASLDAHSSRSTSPLPPSGGTTNGGRRRRPPPPPIDRQTKSSAIQQSKPEVGYRRAKPDLAADLYAASASEELDDHNHLTKYMEHLQLTSERGYGW